MAKFNRKTFNPQAFGAYVDRIPKLKSNELIKSRAIKPSSQIKQVFSGQTGTVYAIIPMYGRLEGEALNYDGETDIEAESTTTYDRGVVVIGRAKAWEESDFSEDITGGAGFMSNVAAQVAEFWDEVDQDTILSILSGLYAMTGVNNLKFVDGHTYDITELIGKDSKGELNCLVGPSTLNNAIQKASGDKKKKFTVAFVHSTVATRLENLKLLAYMTHTDANGIERQLQLASWNGRAVIIDDGMPAELVAEHYVKCSATTEGALKVVADDATPAVGEVTITDTGMSVVAGDYIVLVPEYVAYTTYVMGDGAFDYADIGAEVPYEMSRDPKTKGGRTLLYTRQRKCFAPFGISFKKQYMATNSPTNSELSNGGNWEVVNDGGTGAARKYIDHKSIAIARIISRG